MARERHPQETPTVVTPAPLPRGRPLPGGGDSASSVVMAYDSLAAQFSHFPLQQGEIFFDLVRQIVSVELSSRVVGDEVLATVVLNEPSPHCVDTRYAQQLLGSHAAQHDDQSGVDQLDLLEQIIRGAGLDLVLLRRTILRWASFP